MSKNPKEVLELAYELYQQGKYLDSLRNYQWFFNNAVKIDSTWEGAKYRSLKEWYCLAKKYPPAYEALIEQKNESLKMFKKYKDVLMLSEYAKICNILELDKEFINLFTELCNTEIDLAKSAYISIENILIENREWELCNLCIDNSIEKYNMLLAIFDELLRISEGAYNGEYNPIYEKKFEKDIQNLLWILKVGNRENEINNILSTLKIDLLKRNIEIE